MIGFIDCYKDFKKFFEEETVKVDIAACNHLDFIFDVSFEKNDIFVSLQILLNVIEKISDKEYICEVSRLLFFCSESDEPEEVFGFIKSGTRFRVNISGDSENEAEITAICQSRNLFLV